MTLSLRRRLLVLVPVLCVTAACGSESSSSPAAPSANGTSRGAVITGRVNGMSTAATAPGTVSTMANTRLTVTIVGTNISTTVDGSGQFTLNGVPPGDVRLNFSGNGANATITLSGVSATDRITITVSLNGNAAHIESEQREHDDNEDHANEVKGVVSNLSGSCVTLTFIVQGTTVKTNSTTKFEDGPCTRIQNGTRVDVEGTRQADGSILATEVELDD